MKRNLPFSDETMMSPAHTGFACSMARSISVFPSRLHRSMSSSVTGMKTERQHFPQRMHDISGVFCFFCDCIDLMHQTTFQKRRPRRLALARSFNEISGCLLVPVLTIWPTSLYPLYCKIVQTARAAPRLPVENRLKGHGVVQAVTIAAGFPV